MGFGFPFSSLWSFGEISNSARLFARRKSLGGNAGYLYYMAIWNITQWNIILNTMPRAIYKKEHKMIVERLKKARIEAGLGQIEVAEKLGRTQSYLSKIESGQRRFDVLQLKEFAKIYKKPLDYFVK